MPLIKPQSGESTPRDSALILLAAFIAVLPLLLRGASCGHDLDFHMTSWMEAGAQWQHGILWPRWAFTPAWGAGEPRFVFYPPLSWLLGGILGLAMPIRFVPAAFSFVALAACGFTLRRLASEWTAPPCALLAAVFFMVNPYMLFCVYERCAYGELLAASWMPLLVLAALRTPISARNIAIPVALLWLTNAPSAVMSCYLFAFIALLRLLHLYRNAFTGKRLHTILPFVLRAIGGVALGIGLAAFYIVPAVWERRWVRIQMAIIPPMDVQSNTLFRRTFDPDHDGVLHTASCLALLMIAIAAVFLFAAWRQHRRSHRSLVAQIAAAACVIVFALTPLSLFAWQHLPQLRFIQFPWRTLALLGVLSSLLLALAVRGRSRILLVCAVVLPLALVPPAYRQFSQRCFDDDIPSVQVANFHAGFGTSSTDEYTPFTSSSDVPPALNTYWFANDPNSLNPHDASLPSTIDFNLTQSFHAPAAHAKFLIIRLRNYPAWQVRINGAPAQLASRSEGLLAIALPPGESDVTVRYRILPDQILGILLSLIALIIFLLLRRGTLHRGMHALSIPIQHPSSPFMPAALPT